MTGSREALLHLIAQNKVGTVMVPTFSNTGLPIPGCHCVINLSSFVIEFKL
jgi:hypothetical protein